MKLFSRYNRINLLATVVVFLLSSLAYFFLIRYILVDQVDDDLKIEQSEITMYVEKHQALPEVVTIKDQRIAYEKVGANGGKRKFKESVLPDEHGRDAEAFRQLVFFIQAKDQWYEVTVSKSLEGTDELIRSIAGITLLTILLILIIFVLINRLVLRRLWQPFYATLDAMRRFELEKNNPPVFARTDIDEFTLMNETLHHAMSKAGQDYLHLKEFTENASHELQTPLAVVQSKLDLLIQDEGLHKNQSKNLQDAYEAIQRLSRLNKGLILLMKIENGQFHEIEKVDFSEKLKDKTRQFEELLTAKKISIHENTNQELPINMNPLLADIILNNLFSNATKHNHEGGQIWISTSADSFSIRSTGKRMPLDSRRLFQRFGKNSTNADGVGLGLAILKQAVLVSGLIIKYDYQEGIHGFEISTQAKQPA